MTLLSFRRSAAGAAAILMLASCSHSTAKIEVGALSDDDTAHYLILSDRLRWIRDVKEVEDYAGPDLTVCVGVVPESGGLSTANAAIVERLRNEPANQQRIKLDIVSTWECLAHYTTNDGPFVAEPSDVLAYARHAPGGACGDWEGGTSDRGIQEYRIEVDDGFVTLGGGHGCAAYQRWIRT